MTMSCCAVGCKNRFDKNNKTRKFYRIPSTRTPFKANKRHLWLQAIKRRDWNEQIIRNATLCSDHFISGKASDDIDSPDFVPSIFPNSTWDDSDAELKRCKRKRRFDPTLPATSMEQQQQPESSAPDSTADSYQRLYMETCISDHSYCVTAAVRADLLVKENEALQQIKKKLQHQLEELQLRNRFCVQRLAGSDEDICFYTRFASYRHLEAFWKLVEPAVNTMMFEITGEESSDSSPQATKLPPFDELLLFLMYLSVGLTLRDIADRFGIDIFTASRIIDTWTHFLFTLLGSECLWTPPEVIKANLPPEFSAFPDTRVVLDCVEIFCQTPSSLLLQSEAFLTYKSQALKAMIGIAPHGAITFVSRLFAGYMSDREIFKLSGITQLLTPDMAIMVDRGFVVDGLAPCKVYQPAFFSRNSQMSRKDVKETHAIAHLRVHLERCMSRVKENKLFDSDVPLSVSGNISELFSVACYLVNYQN